MVNMKMSQREPEWIEHAPIHVSASRVIPASPDRVWEVIADHEQWSTWFPAIRRVEVTGSPTGVGGQRRVTASGLRIDEVFTAWEPGEHFAFTVTGVRPPLLSALAESVRLAPDGDGTRVTYRQGFEPRPGLGWMWKLMRPRLQSALDEALGGLAAHVT